MRAYHWFGLGIVTVAAGLLVALAIRQVATAVVVPTFEARIASRLAERPSRLRWPDSGRYVPVGAAARGGATEVARRLAALDLSVIGDGDSGQAMALLAAGAVTDAVPLLERALRSHPEQSSILAALAAAYVARDAVAGNPRDLPRALDLTGRVARLVGDTATVRFNQAAILDGLGLAAAASRAWQTYLAAEPTGAYADEVVARRRADAFDAPATPIADLLDHATDIDHAAVAIVAARPEDARVFSEITAPARWGEAIAGDRPADAALFQRQGMAVARVLEQARGNAMAAHVWDIIESAPNSGRRALAQAHVQLAEGIALYDRDLRSDALVRYLGARDGLRRAGSPAWLTAELNIGIVANQQRRPEDALRHADIVRREGERQPYGSLLARESLLRGVIYFVARGAAEAFPQYRAAIALYTQVGETADAAIAQNTAADSSRMIGDPFEGWGYVRAALASVDRVASPFRRYQIYFSAANLSLQEGWTQAALVFQNLALREAESRGPTGVGFVVEGLIRRSVIRATEGDTAGALADLDAAEVQVPAIAEASARAYHTTWIRAQRGLAMVETNPRLSRQMLSMAVDGFRVIEPTTVPALLAARANAALAAGDLDTGYKELLVAADELEQRRVRVGESGARISYFDRAWRLYQSLVPAVLAATGDPYDALKASDRGKARSLAEVQGMVLDLPSLAVVQAEIGEGGGVLAYSVLPEKTLWWLLRPHHFSHGEILLTETELERHVDEVSESLQTGRTAAAQLGLERLHTLIFRDLVPAEITTLQVVPDGALHRVPFAALRNQRTGRFVVESLAVATAPSLRVALRASRTASALRTPQRVLAVARTSADTTAGLPALPGAVAEAEAVAALYEQRVVLVNDAASPARFLEEAVLADVVHFAGHSVANDSYPSMSYLLLSPGGHAGSGALFGYQLLSLMKAPPAVVVLAACRTGAGAVPRGEGPVGLAWPLMGAGVPSVIASLWDLQDAVARQMMPAFHRGLRAGLSSPAALRAAQLEYLKLDPDVTKWGALTAIGAVSLHATDSATKGPRS